MRQDQPGIEWPTLFMLAATYALWILGTTVLSEFWLPLGILAVALATTQHSSLQHEVLHGHPFANRKLNEALVFPGFSLLIPFRRFRDTHLAHHHDPILTDPYDDPESNFQDPAVWEKLSPVSKAVLRANNTLLGRMALGPAIALGSFLATEFRLLRQGNAEVQRAWLLHGIGVAMVVAWLFLAGSMPIWAFLLAVYLSQSLLRIRTFLEHRAHEAARARTVIVEDRGPLALLFLNNNLHVVHHMHPNLSWYRLPGVYRANSDHYLRRNDGYLYRSYAEIFRHYFLKAKDPVPHPSWPFATAGNDDASPQSHAGQSEASGSRMIPIARPT